jgi:hypothetical protein
MHSSGKAGPRATCKAEGLDGIASLPEVKLHGKSESRFR